MIIESSYINFDVEHEKTITTSSSFNLEAFKLQLEEAQEKRGQDILNNLPSAKTPSLAALLNPSEQDASIKMLFPENFFERFNSAPSTDTGWSGEQSVKSNLFSALMRALTNNEFYTLEDSDLPSQADADTAAETDVEAVEQGEIPSFRSLELINLKVNMTEQRSEYECTQFSACGSVQTADGRSIDLNLQLTMERSYSETVNVEADYQQIRFKDPLVLNFDGYAAELTEGTYEFDLDADGELDSINLAGEHSALLALDLNQDGIINDGSELFGALSGDGFADLAAYDEDGNNFIDEADSIFTDLLLWSKDAEGTDDLVSLADRGIGAIYLGSSSTPFDLKDEQNDTRGRVVETGIYLTESGEVGNAQQVDLVV